MSRVARPLRLLVALAMVGALTGCVSIPTSGPVVRADQSSAHATTQVEIAPQAPAPDASPRAIVNGFLQAMAAYEPDYATARQYLTPAVRDSWQPTSGITVYADGHAVTDTGGTVVLNAPVTGRVDARGAYTPVKGQVDTDFGLTRTPDGQWRISRPPQGLLVSQFVFEHFFQHVNLFWPEPNGQYLVPDQVSLAQGRVTPTTLVDALTAGPGDWISPAVQSALPGGTRLNSPVTVDSAGVATVDLAGELGTLDMEQRRLLAGQLTWTLGQLPTVTGVKVLYNGGAYALGTLANQAGVVATRSPSALSPIPAAQDTHMFGITGGKVVRVDQGDQSGTGTPVPGPFGAGGTAPESLAVSPSADMAAVVTGGGSRLTAFDLKTGTTSFTLTGLTQALRPQFARTGELWLVSGTPGNQHLQIVERGQVRDVDTNGLAGERISAFRLSPDGVRLAAVVERGGHPTLAVARVDRHDGKIRVDGLRVLPLVTTAQAQLISVSDVGWIGAGRLVVLGTAQESTQPSPYRLDLNAVSVEQIGQADRWQARSIATLANPESPRMVIVGDQGSAWRYEDDFTWPQLAQNFTAVAYPG